MTNCSGHSHDHEHEVVEEVSIHLRDLIDFTGVTCLNESVSGSCKSILKSYQERLLSSSSSLVSTVDPELLLHVPFTEAVTITSLSICGPTHSGRTTNPDGNPSSTRNTSTPTTNGPWHIDIYVDRNDLDFDIVQEMTPAMTLELVPPHHEREGETIDYYVTNRGKFQNISSVTLYVRDNFGGDNDESLTEVRKLYIYTHMYGWK
jgi:hypothetical protein